jgi:hypothetical protein
MPLPVSEQQQDERFDRGLMGQSGPYRATHSIGQDQRDAADAFPQFLETTTKQC